MSKNTRFDQDSIRLRFKKLLTGNKGHWSEIYLLCYVLANCILYGGDKQMNILKHLSFSVTKAIRIESQPFSYRSKKTKGIRRRLFFVEFRINHNKGAVEVFRNNKGITRIPLEDFKYHASVILTRLISQRTRGSIFIRKLQEFMRRFKCYQLRIPVNGKIDIILDLVNVRTRKVNRYKLSIKSMIGSLPTLLPFSLANVLTFLVTGISDKDMEKINKKRLGRKNYIKGKIRMIYSIGGKIEFYCTKNDIFGDNLTLIDRTMSIILANCLIYYYRDGIKSTKKLIDSVIKLDPLGVRTPRFYILKIKKFLLNLSTGFDVDKTWLGVDKSKYGCVMVKKVGDLVMYGLHDRKTYEDFLLENTKLDTPSSKRRNRIKNKSNENRSNDEYLFGELYKEKGNMLLDLGLQIRFDEPM